MQPVPWEARQEPIVHLEAEDDPTDGATDSSGYGFTAYCAEGECPEVMPGKLGNARAAARHTAAQDHRRPLPSGTAGGRRGSDNRIELCRCTFRGLKPPAPAAGCSQVVEVFRRFLLALAGLAFQ